MFRLPAVVSKPAAPIGGEADASGALGAASGLAAAAAETMRIGYGTLHRALHGEKAA